MAPPKLDVCKNGHPRTPDNVTSNRGCRTCANDRARARGRVRVRPLRGHRNGRKTHCVHGHEFTIENTYMTPAGVRQCRECRRERVRSKTHPRVYKGETRWFAEVLRQDPCSYCGAPGGQADHIDPVSLGGVNFWENLTGACERCNRSKYDRPLLIFLLERAA